MSPDSRGYVYADIYTFDPSNYCSIVRELALFPGYLEAASGERWNIEIQVPALTTSILRDVLQGCE